MRRFKQLLERTDSCVAICVEPGDEEPAYLRRVLKRITSLSRSEYRAKY